MQKYTQLQIGDTRHNVYFLGYKLRLTPSEYTILLALSKADKVSIEDLAELLDLERHQKGNVAVHICSINRKSSIIGSRYMILCERSEYYINPQM